MRRYPLLVVSIVLSCLFLFLRSNLSSRFAEVEQGYREGTAVNLSRGLEQEKLTDVLLYHNYVSHRTDAEFIAGQVVNKLQENDGLSNLYELNKRIWQVDVAFVDSLGGPALRERLDSSRVKMGWKPSVMTNKFISELKSDTTLSQKEKGRLEVIVTKRDATANVLRCFWGRKVKRCPSVVVRLSEHYLDSLKGPQSEVLAYLKTDVNGRAVFKGLDVKRSYSVIPIKKDFEYGESKGTVGGSLYECAKSGKLKCKFTEQPHKIPLLDNRTLKQIKEDHSITVRMPNEFKSLLIKWLVLFFAFWWGLYVLVKCRRIDVDTGIFAILMFLTGLCLLTMFSINEPLTDKILGGQMTQGILIGIVVIGVILSVDFVKLYQNKSFMGFDVPGEIIKWLFKPFRSKISYLILVLRKEEGIYHKLLALGLIVVCLPFIILDFLRFYRLSDWVNHSLNNIPKGETYLLAALILTVLLFTPLGMAVGGMKVNLNFAGVIFQPSEIAKYLTVVFMAAFFCQHADVIIQYSREGNYGLWKNKFRMLTAIFLGLGILMLMYLLLGDMGPALVLAFTFIFLYSMVKSKVDLENSHENQKLQRILTCDLAMLAYGIISFILFLLIGRRLDNMDVFCFVWFGVWILFGIFYKKQLFESAIFFNLIFVAFIYGGTLCRNIGLESIGERLESRKEMCVNTWGNLGLDGGEMKAGENEQVAEGLWGLATGGLSGQGLANGNTHLIPAFHTDMILESVGEQMGFVGLLLIVVVLALLLRKTIIIGYRSKHAFVFYLCLGIAIVMGVQFLMIALGSTGIIPLTGVSVPFLSFGKVSMILNLAAFGVVLSVSKSTNNAPEEGDEVISVQKQKNIGKYNYPVSVLSWLYVIFILMTLGVFLNYQLFDRNQTLIRPVYIHNDNGEPLVLYNPRIELLTKKMRVGDIYDRNGILLATSNKYLLKDDDTYEKLAFEIDTLERRLRYYPFGNHLFFMLGDYNSKLHFSDAESALVGYMAESRHLSYLRGYDNVLYDALNQPVKKDLLSYEYRANKYLPANDTISKKDFQIRDYSTLLPYLKNGINGNRIRKLNSGKEGIFDFGKIEPKDLHLTVDACLQTRMQQAMEQYCRKRKYADNKKWNKLRISIVILNAKNGELLTSANYPLPDYKKLKLTSYYSDNRKNPNWRAYTDRDLGLVYQTQPGSTAKIISALAGLRVKGDTIIKKIYRIHDDEIIESKKRGSTYDEPIGNVDMERALVESSNCYFIHLVNDYELYTSLGDMFSLLGVRIKRELPYQLYYTPMTNKSLRRWNALIDEEGQEAVKIYREYIKQRDNRQIKPSVMKKHDAWMWAWGQGEVVASPLNMARAVSIIANKGMMPTTKYVLSEKSSSFYWEEDSIKAIPVVSEGVAMKLHHIMTKEAARHHFYNMGGKTGTAERTRETDKMKRTLKSRNKEKEYVTVRQNDGWYICFINDASIHKKVNGISDVETAPLAIAVRMERLGEGMSDCAVELTDKVVLKILRETGYIKGADNKKESEI